MASQLDMFPSPCEPGDDIFVKLPPPLKLRHQRRLDDESMAQLLEERGSDRVLRGGLQKPTVPIPPEITRLTEISDEMVAGQMIDVGLLGALIDPADVVIAHNARFDRPFCEAFSSMSEIYQWEEAVPPLKRLTALIDTRGDPEGIDEHATASSLRRLVTAMAVQSRKV